MAIVSALAVTTHTLVGLPPGKGPWLTSVGTFETLAVTPRHDGQIDTVPWQVCQQLAGYTAEIARYFWNTIAFDCDSNRAAAVG